MKACVKDSQYRVNAAVCVSLRQPTQVNIGNQNMDCNVRHRPFHLERAKGPRPRATLLTAHTTYIANATSIVNVNVHTAQRRARWTASTPRSHPSRLCGHICASRTPTTLPIDAHVASCNPHQRPVCTSSPVPVDWVGTVTPVSHHQSAPARPQPTLASLLLT